MTPKVTSHLQDMQLNYVPFYDVNESLRNHRPRFMLVPNNGELLTDCDGRKWRIKEEHRWTNLCVPLSDSNVDNVDCAHVTVADVLHARYQLAECNPSENKYINSVVGDGLSPVHLREISNYRIHLSGKDFFDLLKKTPITTRLEYAAKREANIRFGYHKRDMTGCSGHKIKGFDLTDGDFQGDESHAGQTEGFEKLRGILESKGPFYGSIYAYGRSLPPILGREGMYYTRGEKDTYHEGMHASMVVGWGRCELERNERCWGNRPRSEYYWVIQNNWGHNRTKYGRMSNECLRYGLSPELG